MRAVAVTDHDSRVALCVGSAIAVSMFSLDNVAMTVIITTIGAVLTTLVGVLVGSVLSSRSQQRQWSRDRQAQPATRRKSAVDQLGPAGSGLTRHMRHVSVLVV